MPIHFHKWKTIVATDYTKVNYITNFLLIYQSLVETAHCEQLTAYCILHTENCALCTAQWRLKTKLYTVHCTLHTAHCTLDTEHYTLHTAYCKLHTAHCTLHMKHRLNNAYLVPFNYPNLPRISAWRIYQRFPIFFSYFIFIWCFRVLALSWHISLTISPSPFWPTHFPRVFHATWLYYCSTAFLSVYHQGLGPRILLE